MNPAIVLPVVFPVGFAGLGSVEERDRFLSRWAETLQKYRECKISRADAAIVGGAIRVSAGDAVLAGRLTQDEFRAIRDAVLLPAVGVECATPPAPDASAGEAARLREGYSRNPYADPGLWRNFVEELEGGSASPLRWVDDTAAAIGRSLGVSPTIVKWAGLALGVVGVFSLVRR